MVKAVERNTVNSLRVEKEIERVESCDLQMVLQAVMDAISKETKQELQQMPDSQKSWDEEQKEGKEAESNRERVKQAQEGGRLMQKFKKKVMQKYEKVKEIERSRKVLNKNKVYYETNKRQKVDEDDELPLFG